MRRNVARRDARQRHVQHQAVEARIAYQQIAAASQHKQRQSAGARPAQRLDDLVLVGGLGKIPRASSHLQGGVGSQRNLLLNLHCPRFY